MRWTIIYAPTLAWTFLFQRPQQLARQFARAGHTVLFCEPGRRGAPEEIELNLFLAPAPGPWVLTYSNRVFWHSCPLHHTLAEVVRPAVHWFDHLDEACDEFAVFAPGVPDSIRKSHLITATSARLLDICRGSHLVRNAADVEHFTRAPEPRPGDLPVAGPVIGFWGALWGWIDCELLEHLARARPGWQIVLIGPVAGSAGRLRHALPNLHVLGERPYDTLPEYAAHFDVALVPFQVRAMTLACNPIKVYEYLAAGLPVVSTDLPECRVIPEVRLAADREGFLAAVEDALTEGRDPAAVERRRAVARANSWAHRAGDILALLGDPHD